MKSLIKAVLFFFLTIILLCDAKAQNFNDALRLSEPGFNSNARALGMGNAYTSLSNDFSGTIFNPAGLGLVRKMEFTGGLNSYSLQNSTTFFDNITDYTNSTTDLNQIGFVFPFPTYRGSLVFALGYNMLKNFNFALKFNGFNDGNNSMIQYLSGYKDISWELFLTDSTGYSPINGGLNQHGDILVSGRIGSWSLSGAMEVSEDVFFGGTVNVLSGSYKSDRRYYETDVMDYYDSSFLTDPAEPETSDFQSFYLNDIIDWDISGWDFKLGFLYNMPGFLTVGATVKFPSQFNVKETHNIYAEAEFGSGTTFILDPEILNRREYDITTPYEFTLGGSLEAADLIVSADVKYIDYTQMEFSDGLMPSERSQINRDIRDIFRNVINYNLGFEYELPVFNILLRGGFIYNKSPFQGDTSEYDKKYFTGGVGFAASRNLRVDISYAHGWWKNFGDNYDSGVSRTYQDLTSDNVVFSVTYGMR